jgi:hypothetical protein
MFINDQVIEHWASLGNDALSAPPTLVPFTLHSGDSLSDAVEIPDGMRALGVGLPAAWTDSDLSMQVSFDGETFFEVTNAISPTLTQIYTNAGRAGFLNYISVWQLMRAKFFKLRSGSLGSETAQGADRVIQLVCINCNAADH